MDTDLPPRPQNAGPVPVNDPALRQAIRRGHETREIRVKALCAIAGSLLVTLVVVAVFMVWVFKAFEHVHRKLDARNARTESGARSLVQEAPDYQGPLLQVTPEEDLRWMKEHAASDLSSYGWIDRKAGVVRIPVDRAMDLIVESGLPPTSPGLTLEALQRQRADPQVFGQALRP